eukprot:gene20975-1152_t
MCGECGTSEIHQAIKDDDIEKVKLLVEEGYVNQRSPCGKTPLMSACYHCRKSMIGYLLERGAVYAPYGPLMGSFNDFATISQRSQDLIPLKFIPENLTSKIFMPGIVTDVETSQ